MWGKERGGGRRGATYVYNWAIIKSNEEEQGEDGLVRDCLISTVENSDDL